MRRVACVLVLAATVAACRGAAVSAPPVTPAPIRAVTDLPPLPLPTGTAASIRLTHAGADAWIAEYALPEPVRALAFGRQRIARTAWRVVEPPGATLAGGYVVAAQPFSRVRIELPTDTVQPEKEYRPFTRYTDSGVVAYTGQLSIAHAVCSVGDCASGQGLTRGTDYAGTLSLVAAAGEKVVVRGQTPAPEASVALGDDGTCAYFGNVAPVETASFVGVVDRGLPEWMRSRVSADLPRLFALYAGRFGALDGPKATVFLAFAAREHGMSLGGGVLRPHLLTLDLELSGGGLTENAATRLSIDRLVAHEAAHFWNDDQHNFGGNASAAWLDEGGADALATRALHATGVLEDAAYRDTLSQAASECALWLSTGEPLTASTRPGHSRAFYVCGSTLDLIAEAAVERSDPKADLFTFWQAVFDEGKPAYDEAAFLRVLDRLGGDPKVTEAVRHLVHDRIDDPAGALREALQLAGLPTTIGQGALPADYEQHASIPEMDALLPRACAQALLFDGDVEVRPRVGADGACPGLARGDVIDSIAGIPVGPDGATSFRQGAASCRARQVVDVITAKQAHATLPCDPHARPAPDYLEIGRVP